MPVPSSSKNRKKRRAYHRGIMAEYLALAQLALKGYRPVAMRYKTPFGEVDLIMRRGKTLVFVEVKARRTQSEAAVAVHFKNQSRVMQAALHFLSKHRNYESYQVRFDVCLVAWYRLPHHIPHAFQAHS